MREKAMMDLQAPQVWEPVHDGLGEEPLAGCVITPVGYRASIIGAVVGAVVLGLVSFGYLAELGARVGCFVGSLLPRLRGKPSTPHGLWGPMYIAAGPTKVAFFETKERTPFGRRLIGKSELLVQYLHDVPRRDILACEFTPHRIRSSRLTISSADDTVYQFEVPGNGREEAQKVQALLAGRPRSSASRPASPSPPPPTPSPYARD